MHSPLLSCLPASTHRALSMVKHTHTHREPHCGLLYNAVHRATTTPTHTHTPVGRLASALVYTDIQDFQTSFLVCRYFFVFQTKPWWRFRRSKREKERKLMITRKRLNLRHFLVNCERMSLLHAVPTGFWTFFWVGEDCQPCLLCVC